MESISSENLPIVLHTLNQIELAIDRLQERTQLLPTYPSIPWKKVMGIRDIMAHHYFEVDADVVFEVINKELEPLKKAILFFKEQI